MLSKEEELQMMRWQHEAKTAGVQKGKRMSKVIVESSCTSMKRLVIEMDEELVSISIQEITGAEGGGDGSYKETIAPSVHIDLDLEDIKTVNDVIERWMYAAIDRNHHGDGPRGR